MFNVRQILLDVLKPHSPNVLELAQALADLDQAYQITIDVKGVDEKTETVLVDIIGDHIDYSVVSEVIVALGGSIHSIDRVEVHGSQNTNPS